MKLNRKRIEMIKQNENGAFDEIYLTYYKLVKYVIYELVKSDSDAEDLTQDVFVKVFLRIDTFIPGSDMTSWISSIARNTAKDFLKSKKNKTSIIYTDYTDISFADDEDAYCATDELDKKMRTILDDTEYMVVIHRLYFDLKFKDIADMMDENIAKIASKYYRAIGKLKKNLKKEDFYD